MLNSPTAPIPIAGGAADAKPHFTKHQVPVSDTVLARLANACETIVDASARAEISRDWWPLAMTWATDGEVPALPAVIARPHTADGVAEVLRICNESKVPVTPAAGRSGVQGGSIPLHGGVSLDLTGLTGIKNVDKKSMIVDVGAGHFGDDYENELRTDHGVTGGHWPQSIALSTIGGWLACRGAGQYSTRYGKIEDLVVGLDVVLADGTEITTGGAPRSAVGPDLNQLFVGSEGTLGVITGARLKIFTVPTAEMRRAFGFDSFEEGLDACRRILHRGGTPAVLRLYDALESDRNFSTGDRHVLLVLDEADPALIAASETIVDQECANAERLDTELVEEWLGHRNNVDALESLINAGFVVDTMEVAAPWADLDRIYNETIAAISAVPGTMAVGAHQSHAYSEGACLYFTFAGHKDKITSRDEYYNAAWDAGTLASLNAGAALSHHHGIGLNRGRFMADAMGPAFRVLTDMKDALDPNGILNPGKLGLASPWT